MTPNESDIELAQSSVRQLALDHGLFKQAVDAFVKLAPRPNLEHDTLEKYDQALEGLVQMNLEYVSQKCESSIERIFLNTLILAFIQQEPFGLVMYEAGNNAIEEIEFFLYAQTTVGCFLAN